MFKVERLRKIGAGCYEATLTETSFDTSCVIHFKVNNGQLVGNIKSVDTLGLDGAMLASAYNYLNSPEALTEAMTAIRKTVTSASHK